ncbi:MAG: hypothetical protein ACW963_05780 [Candidatus Sifarchaeia archaeon]
MNETLQARKACHCPIIGADERSKPYLVGTGVVLSIDSQIFIASAAHVFDENEITSIYTFLEGKDQIIEGEIQATSKPGNNRDEDKIDIAILKVDDSLIPKFMSTYCPVTIDEIDVNDIPHSKKYYAFIGHPTNKTKPKFGTTIMKREMFSYMGTIVTQKAYQQLDLSIYSHIVIGFDPKKCIAEDGIRYTFPKPKGMSGGGVWLMEDLNSHSSRSYVNKLVGIGIEDHKNPEVMVGTRIGAVIEVIKKGFPDCKNLPKTNFKINDV